MKELLKKIIPPQVMGLYYTSWSVLGAFIYRNPSAHIRVVGITGTNGKTSTTHITTNLFEQAGVPVASISTLRFKIKDKEWTNQFKMTMPGRLHIQKFMRQAVDAGCKVVVMEVTSEGVVQKRHHGIQFDTVVFTNLTPEHIERHGSFEAYKDAKLEFFSVPHRVAVVNADDEHGKHFADKAKGRVVLYSKTQDIKPKEKAQELLQAMDASSNSKGISFDIQGVHFQADLLGAFNIDNSLAAVGVCVGYGLDLQRVATAFQKVQAIAGRAEIVMNEPCVVVDYAHTPDGLEKLYEMTRSVKQPSGKTICVLGSAGGGRDKWKRPEMGEIADKNCDSIILTDEDPYDEDPMEIVEAIYGGVVNKEKAQIVIDRRQAVATALKLADKQDIVVVSGKGAEPLMVVAGGKKLKWDDRQVVKEEWEKLRNNKQ